MLQALNLVRLQKIDTREPTTPIESYLIVRQFVQKDPQPEARQVATFTLRTGTFMMSSLLVSDAEDSAKK